MDDKLFTWTPERTHKLFELRFENEWLFKKKKQPWKEFRNILLQNGFPEEMSLDHVRKKWSYTYDCYKIAKNAKNKKWIYYKIFDKHFRKNKALDRYESWNDEWRLKLINSIVEAKNNSDNHNIIWRTVECDLRSQNLPNDCCIQDIKALWQHLQTIFNRKYRIRLKKGADISDWPLYDAMLDYIKTFQPNVLLKLEEEGCVFPRVRNSSINYCKKIKDEKSDNDQYEDFQWSRDVTESFIQLRLQHESMFRERKWAWNDLAATMINEYGFPKHLTGRVICHKWSSTYADYQKAKATSNTNWVYYNLFELYLGEGSLSFDPVKNWKEEWICKLITIRTELEEFFCDVEKPHTAWREVEKQLRSQGIPIDHSLLELTEIWVQLRKTFKWKRKFANKGILNENWPYYEAMVKYIETKSRHDSHYKKLNNTMINYNDNVDMNTDDFEDDIKLFDLKKKLQTKPKIEVFEVNSCRACSHDDGCVYLFEPFDENGLDLASKLMIIGGIEVDKADNLPNQICISCMKELENAYNFRVKCQTLDNQYRNIKDNAVKLEININANAEHTLDGEEKVEDYHIADNGVFDNDDNVDGIDNIGVFKVEDKNLVTVDAKHKKIRKKRILKSRKKYSYDYTRVCEVCGKRSRNIKNHMDSHATEKCYDCEQCGKKFKFKSGLVIHKAVHNPVPKKTCEVCGKTFHIMAQFRKHYVYHANERRFTCETCGKAFHTKEILTVHMRMHTDERPFTCSECGKTFRTAGCVSRHKKIVHKKIVKT